MFNRSDIPTTEVSCTRAFRSPPKSWVLLSSFRVSSASSNSVEQSLDYFLRTAKFARCFCSLWKQRLRIFRYSEKIHFHRGLSHPGALFFSFFLRHRILVISPFFSWFNSNYLPSHYSSPCLNSSPKSTAYISSLFFLTGLRGTPIFGFSLLSNLNRELPKVVRDSIFSTNWRGFVVLLIFKISSMSF